MPDALSRLLLAIQTLAREGFTITDLDRDVSEPFNADTDVWRFTAENAMFAITATFDANSTTVDITIAGRSLAAVTIAHDEGSNACSSDVEFLLAALRACSQEPF